MTLNQSIQSLIMFKDENKLSNHGSYCLILMIMNLLINLIRPTFCVYMCVCVCKLTIKIY